MKIFFGALFLFFFPISVFASTPYMSLKVGTNYLQNADVGKDLQMKYDFGYGFMGALGTVPDFLNKKLRTELEFSYNANHFDKTVSPTEESKARGVSAAWGLLGNVIHTIPVSRDSEFFLGAGAGVIYLHFDPKGWKRMSDWVPAYQGIFGWSTRMTTYDFFEIQYRYLVTDSPRFDGFDSDYRSHALFVGFRMEL